MVLGHRALFRCRRSHPSRGTVVVPAADGPGAAASVPTGPSESSPNSHARAAGAVERPDGLRTRRRGGACQRPDQHPAAHGGGDRSRARPTLRLSLIAYALRRKVWIAGFLDDRRLPLAVPRPALRSPHHGAAHLDPGAALPGGHPGDLVPSAAELEGVGRGRCRPPAGWPPSWRCPRPVAATRPPTSTTGGSCPRRRSRGARSPCCSPGWGPRRGGRPWFGTAGAIAFAFTAALIKTDERRDQPGLGPRLHRAGRPTPWRRRAWPGCSWPRTPSTPAR